MQTNFEEIRFPENYSIGAIATTVTKTNIIQTVNGELRDPISIRSRKRFDISQLLKTNEDKDYILSFFEVMGGPVTGFRFKDWTEYKVSLQQGIANIDGVVNNQTSFQLYKKYSIAGINRFTAKPIYKIVTNGRVPFKIFKDGIDKTSIYTLNQNTGIIETNGEMLSVGSVITWQGEFDFPVRFSDDQFLVKASVPLSFDFDNIVFDELRNI